MSLITGRLDFDGTPQFLAGPLRLPLPARLQAFRPKLDSPDVVLGVREEAVKLKAVDHTVAGHVKSHEWVGRKQQLVVQVGANQIRMRGEADMHVHIGDPIGLAISLEDATLFSSLTGEAL
jgi:ABC-type sugar transport system ATPase subunit